jgi:hypothetical protein
MPFVCHAPIHDGLRSYDRGDRVSDADGARLTAENPGALTRVPFDLDHDSIPSPDPIPAKSFAPALAPDTSKDAVK